MGAGAGALKTSLEGVDDAALAEAAAALAADDRKKVLAALEGSTQAADTAAVVVASATAKGPNEKNIIACNEQKHEKKVKKRYRLRYHAARGRAEVSRLMFNMTPGMQWEDKRYPIEFIWQKDGDGNDDRTKWPTIVRDEFNSELAAGGFDTGMGMLPILDVITEALDENGEPSSVVGEKSFGQSMAIERYIARVCDLMGEDSNFEEAAQIEQVAESVRDLAASFNTNARKDEEAKEKWFGETLPEKLKLLEKSLPRSSTSIGPWLIGSKCSYADVSLFALLCMKAGVKEWDPFIGNAEACTKTLAETEGIPRIVEALKTFGELDSVRKHKAEQPESDR